MKAKLKKDDQRWLYDTRFGQPTIKDGCGVFGVIRKRSASKISNLSAVKGISCIKYRGSSMGAGYACFENEPSTRPYLIKAFVKNAAIVQRVAEQLDDALGSLENKQLKLPTPESSNRFGTWQAEVRDSRHNLKIESVVERVNSSLLSSRRIDGRIFSYGSYLEVFKEVGYPLDVARLCNLDSDSIRADMWIAHTRQPTNSPGSFPIWSHPFSSLNCAIVHNGDISSFGSNLEQLNSWGSKSHVGTDSEVIARLLDHLIRVEGLEIEEAATILTNPFERNISQETKNLLLRFRGSRLDGPFAVVAGYADEKDVYMIALTDRSKFRPLIFGEDDDCFYVASEETQIRTISRHARVWTPEPGSVLIASVKRGLISSGTSRAAFSSHQTSSVPPMTPHNSERLDATGLSFRKVNEFIKQSYASGKRGIIITGISGQRYIGIGVSTRGKDSSRDKLEIAIEGYPGNCLANLNDGANFEVFGNAADDLADTMHDGSVIVHGSARDVVAQALQGGAVFIRGSVGNRAAIQMREYKDKTPFLIVGETADDYFGEYMAGGVAIILNLSNCDRPVGNYIGTGMVGGTIFVRGRIKQSQLGLLPARQDVLNYLKAGMIDGVITNEIYDQIMHLDYPDEVRLEKLLPTDLFKRTRFLFFTSKYSKPLAASYGKLSSSDYQLIIKKLNQFFNTFDLPSNEQVKVLESEFTIIRTKEEKVETPVPPQEVPVEE